MGGRGRLIQELDVLQLEPGFEAVATEVLGNNVLVRVGPLVEDPWEALAKLRGLASDPLVTPLKVSVGRPKVAWGFCRDQVIAIADGAGARLIQQSWAEGMVP